MSEADRIEGEWQLIWLHCGNLSNRPEPVAVPPEDDPTMLFIKGGRYRMYCGIRVIVDLPCRINADKNPKEIDLLPSDDPSWPAAWRKDDICGVYQVEGDKLTIHFGWNRPRDFAKNPAVVSGLYGYRRATRLGG